MRKLYFTAAAAAALFTATGAGADSLFSHTVSLSAKADHVCSVGGAVLASTGLPTVGAASSSLSVAVGAEDIIDQTASLTFKNVFCNGNSTTVRLRREGLIVDVPGPTAAQGFKREIEYEVAVTWGGTNIVALDSTDDETAQIGAMRGDFVIDIHIPASSGPFVADTYNDSLVLTVLPTT